MHPTSATNFMFSPLLIAALCIALGIPLALGKIKPNSFYGFRIAETLNHESVWYKVNEFTGKAFISSGIAIITLTFAALWLGNLLSLGPALLLLETGILLVPIAIAVVASGVVCHRA